MYHKMGSGKTITGLWEAQWHLARIKAEAPAAKFMVICPKSAMISWRAEAQKNMPALVKDMVLIPYSQLKHASLRVKFMDVRFLIFDESHYLKSMETDRMAELVQFMTSLRDEGLGGFKHGRILCLTGTPMPNHAGEVYTTWALCGAKDFSTSIQLLSDEARYNQWRSAFAEEDVKIIKGKKNPMTGKRDRGNTVQAWKGIKNLSKFLALMSPFTHYVEDIGTKTPTIIPVDLQLPDDRLLADANIEEPDAYMALNQRLAVAKVPYLFQWVDEFLRNTNEQLIIFSMYVAPLEDLRARYPGVVELITGAEGMGQRRRNVGAFQAGKLRVLAMSYKCGAESLNLQTAKFALYLGYPWTDSTLKQAMARINRQGQTADTTYHYFLVSGANDYKNLHRVLEKEAATNALEQGLRSAKKPVTFELDSFI
jgi:SNF2 family DNA or RNA helicase